MWLFVPAQGFSRQWLESFNVFQPRGGWNIVSSDGFGEVREEGK